MNKQRPDITNFNQFKHESDFITSGARPQTMTPGPTVQTRNPPSLPPRRSVQNYQIHNEYRPFGTSYNGYGYGIGNNWNNRGLGGYGAYGGYGGYSGYGSYPNIPAYNSYGQTSGPSGDVENRFVQIAEESTRPAFQSIEAMVHTFSSVTMMLESTFFAMTSSFRAILSVAENVGRLRSMFGQFLNTFALFRFMKWLYRKSMYMLGLRCDDPNDEALWQKTALEVINGERTGPSTWPILLFLSMLFAIPYLIHKLVHDAKKVSVNVNNPKEWFQYNEPIYTATALYDFNATSNEELSLRINQKIWLAPQSLQPKDMPGWWRATDSVNVGMIPSTYVTVVGQLKKKTTSNDQLADASSQETSKNVNQNSESMDVSDFEKLEQSYKVESKDIQNVEQLP